MPNSFVILRYNVFSVLMGLTVYEDEARAMAEYNEMLSYYRGCNSKIQLKQTNGVEVRTLCEMVV